ncbi:prephenate dehydratase [Wielerella bovis]|uniref:prephenate dehydratase n=1 Tax=Wielerella bovis TaxID=2917790 RepID=UPI0020184A83|nr:prephenate dehydratase [Wielerella bovis]MCG7656779.1 prephenate dehydratase [Wielerella bovis]MCG7659002.1 prephenate dehydratase [Wielerella bovis]ULJ65483.1 prephenate dehydratase [Wielerella bovis]ULJ66472.1 prephenate dehydratase [Wielerella bovis]
MSDETKLLPHRQAIDAIDQQILTLMNQRAEHAHAIGVLKGTGAVYRPEREAQVLRRIQDLNMGPLPDESVARLFREIMSECLAVERPLTIAYLGPEGTFTQLAAIKHFGHAAKTVACTTVDDSMRMVEARQADYVVAPVENSTEGSVGRTLDLLVSTPLKTCGEVILRVHHHLMNISGSLKDVQTVYAHAQALAQCQQWLNHHLPKTVQRVAVSSNAEAAHLAQQNPQAAAIASQAAAEIYGLTKLATNIEDEPNNTTRFLVLGHQTTTPSGSDKTSLIVSAPNKVGTLQNMIEPFSRVGISMTKFESRPSRTGLWEYVFFIDIEGHIDEPKVQMAIDELQKRAAFVKVVGAYPKAVL